MNLEHVLGNIDADRVNLHVDGPLNGDLSPTMTLWHIDAGSGRRPPDQVRFVTMSPGRSNANRLKCC